jgi:hypothetical protein
MYSQDNIYPQERICLQWNEITSGLLIPLNLLSHMGQAVQFIHVYDSFSLELLLFAGKSSTPGFMLASPAILPLFPPPQY